MGTWGEVAALATDAVRLWRRFLGQLVFWFSIGYAVSLAAREGSARLGSGQIVLANVCFGISLIATACATLLMIHCLGPGLPALQRLLQPVRDGQPAARAPRVDGAPPDLPPDVLEHRDRLDTLAAVVGPVLAVYSVWGLVEDQVRQLFFVNAVVNGLFEPEKWSINFDRIGFYLGGAALVWVVRTALGRVTRHLADEHTPRAGRLARWLTPGYILLEGLWVFLAFAAGRRLVERAQTWWSTRTVQAWLFDLWEGATGLLPTVVVPVSELVRGVGSWLFTTLLPVTFHEVALPLVLLAVTCMVFGWREADMGELAGAAGLRRARTRMGGSSRRLLPRATTLLTEDVRTRFVPLVHSLRMLLRGGPRLVGAFLVLAAALSLMQGAVPWVLLRAVGPTGSYPGVALGYALDLAVGVLVQPLLVALYGAAFDRSLDLFTAGEARAGPPRANRTPASVTAEAGSPAAAAPARP